MLASVTRKRLVLIMAHNVASILNEAFFISPAWAWLAEFLLLVLIAAYLIALLPKLDAGPAALISLGLFIAIFATEVGLMASQAVWLKLMGAATLLVIGFKWRDLMLYCFDPNQARSLGLRAGLLQTALHGS